MAKCHNCGAEYTGNYCEYCGATSTARTRNHSGTPQYNTDFMNGNTENKNYSYTPITNSEKPVSTLSWIGWQLLEMIPLIGLLIMLIFSEDESVKNYAKARLILSLVAIVIAVIAFALFSAIILNFIRGFA